jgi:ABC-type transport system involved in cytochrome bd biosynthesis fused ATPase/permease subunit
VHRSPRPPDHDLGHPSAGEYQNADRILGLEKGMLIEQGTHHESLDSSGLYHELFEIQARAYRAENH